MQSVHDGPDDQAGESLAERMKVLWGYRRLLAAVGLVTLVVVAAVFLFLPSETLSSLRFRLIFDGAEKGEYPSGVKFSPNEIVSRGVLTEEFQANDLQKYGRMEDFQRALFVSAKPSPEMEALNAEFAGKLGGKLNAVERAQIEKEYLEKKASLLNSVEWTLNMLSTSGPCAKMPVDIREKVLRGILDRWSEDAAAYKGAVKYQVAVLGKNILPQELISEENCFLSTDMLRFKMLKIERNIDQLLELPGAKTFRTAKDRISLTEVRSNLDDLLRFKLIPLMQCILAYGMGDKTELTRLYIEGSMSNLELQKKEAADRAQVLEDTLLTYSQERRRARAGVGPSPTTAEAVAAAARMSHTPAMIPQFGDSFLDRIIELTGQSNDVKFRQEYAERITKEGLQEIEFGKELKWYQDVLEKLGAGGSATRPAGVNTRIFEDKAAKDQVSKIYAGVVKACEQVEAIHEELSAKNLNPRTYLFAVWEPASTKTVRLLSLLKMALYGLLVLVAVLGLTAGGCLVHARTRSSRPAADEQPN